MSKLRVVIVGAGFGGLQCARSLARSSCEVVLVDRNNYHVFTPLLYQVASSLLNPSDIAQPVRAMLRRAPNVTFRLGEVVDVEFGERRVRLRDGSYLSWDRLVLAMGSETDYFGSDPIERAALGLKDLPEAMELRNQVLRCLEAAAGERDSGRRRAWLTFVIVGGGATGVEYAGALSELLRMTLGKDFADLAPEEARLVLVEGRQQVLPTFRAPLGEHAGSRLRRRFGVELRLGTLVTAVDGEVIRLSDGTTLRARTLVWAAGVRASRLADSLPLPRSGSGRIRVDEWLRGPGFPGVFANGDVASASSNGGELPMLAPPAIQQARYVAALLAREARSGWPEPFRYRDRGIMATVGRNAGVAQIGPLTLKGFVGWAAWLLVHLLWIIGFRNRLWVLSGWAWNYLLRDRPIRSIVAARRRDTGNRAEQGV